MTSNLHPIIAACLVLARGAHAQFLVLTPEPTAHQIAAKCVEAMGGAAQFASIRSMRIEGRIDSGKVTVLVTRPDRIRVELSAGEERVVQMFDGTTGWQTMGTQSVRLSGEPLKNLQDQAANAIGGPLVEMEARGNRAELLGHEAVEGSDCYKLRVTLATGDVRILFIDASRFLEVAEEIPAASVQQSIGGYRRFGGILVPCSVVTRRNGQSGEQHIAIDSVEINPAG